MGQADVACASRAQTCNVINHEHKDDYNWDATDDLSQLPGNWPASRAVAC